MYRSRPRAWSVYLFVTALLSAGMVVNDTALADRKPCDPDDDTGKRIKCKLENMADSFDALVDVVANDDTALFTETQKKQLDSLKARGRGEAERINPAEYKGQAKKDNREVECVIRERIGDVRAEDDANGNGVCDEGEFCIGNEDGVCQEEEFVVESPYKGGCAELLNDGVGDDDGICDPKGESGQFRETCLEDCGKDATLGEDKEINVDGEKAQEVEQAIVDMTDTLDETTEGLAELIAVRQNVAAPVLFCDRNAPPCEYLDCLIALGRSSSGEYITNLATAAASAGVLLETCRDVGNQTIPIPFVGGSFDSAIACLPIGLAANGVLLTATAVELRDDLETAERVDAIGGCAQSTGGEIGEARALAQEIIDLLRMPPGRRLGYPQVVE